MFKRLFFGIMTDKIKHDVVILYARHFVANGRPA